MITIEEMINKLDQDSDILELPVLFCKYLKGTDTIKYNYSNYEKNNQLKGHLKQFLVNCNPLVGYRRLLMLSNKPMFLVGSGGNPVGFVYLNPPRHTIRVRDLDKFTTSVPANQLCTITEITEEIRNQLRAYERIYGDILRVQDFALYEGNLVYLADEINIEAVAYYSVSDIYDRAFYENKILTFNDSNFHAMPCWDSEMLEFIKTGFGLSTKMPDVPDKEVHRYLYSIQKYESTGTDYLTDFEKKYYNYAYKEHYRILKDYLKKNPNLRENLGFMILNEFGGLDGSLNIQAISYHS